jgi:hypothetical protein
VEVLPSELEEMSLFLTERLVRSDPGRAAQGRDKACKGSVAKKEEAKLSAWAGVC